MIFIFVGLLHIRRSSDLTITIIVAPAAAVAQ